MSRKTKRNAPPSMPPAQPAPTPASTGRRALFIGAAVAMLLAFGGGAYLYKEGVDREVRAAAEKNRALLASEHSPTLGPREAKVHLVEFFDPACETCAAFYPEVKRMMAENPGRIRLSIRHVPFHENSEHAVRVLEASREQDKYWETIGAMVQTQRQWTIGHRVAPDRVLPAIASAGLDTGRIRVDMNLPGVTQRIEKDLREARELGVTKTPGFFVNGRPLERFGLTELEDLVREEVRKAYSG